MFDLTGKKALITGASGGIGSSIAKALHGQGRRALARGQARRALALLPADQAQGREDVLAFLED